MANKNVSQVLPVTLGATLLRASQATQKFARKVEQVDPGAAVQLYRASCWLKTVAVSGVRCECQVLFRARRYGVVRKS